VTPRQKVDIPDDADDAIDSGETCHKVGATPRSSRKIDSLVVSVCVCVSEEDGPTLMACIFMTSLIFVFHGFLDLTRVRNICPLELRLTTHQSINRIFFWLLRLGEETPTGSVFTPIF
jgi:hypothetical protein